MTTRHFNLIISKNILLEQNIAISFRKRTAFGLKTQFTIGFQLIWASAKLPPSYVLAYSSPSKFEGDRQNGKKYRGVNETSLASVAKNSVFID